MEEKISFRSDGLKIAGLIDTPPDYKPGERRPAFIVLHGFGGNKDGHGQTVVAKQFAQWGYVTLRIDFRGCGDSEGEHGRIICLDQVADTRNALTYLATRAEVDSAENRSGWQQLRRRGRGLYRRRGQPRRSGDLLRRLGQRRAQISRSTSDPGRLGQVLQHARRGQTPPRTHRQIAHGAALRHRADTGETAEPHEPRFGHGISRGNRAEHERFSRR